jgi:hypothetical protein
MEIIKYIEGIKYQLKETYVINIGPVPIVGPTSYVSTTWLHLTREGKLTIYEGYCWDGPSGPTIDTPTVMRGSLVHDALYELMRKGHLPISYRPMADKWLGKVILQDVLLKHGDKAFFGKIRSKYYTYAVKKFAAGAASRESIRKVVYAPIKTPVDSGR